MPTPSQQQARSHQAQQAAVATAGAAVVARMVAESTPWDRVLAVFAQYQLAAATLAIGVMDGWAGRVSRVNPAAFAGLTSAGLPLAEPLIATIDRYVPAPAEEIPRPWWVDAARFETHIARIAEGQIKDAGRVAAGVALVADPQWTGYVRVLTPPSCKECVILAGRFYRWSAGFDRHPPTCDCEHLPVTSRAEADALAVDVDDMLARDQVRGLTDGDKRALAEGADLNQVVNSARRTYTTRSLGRSLQATRYGTTRRAQWRRDNPQRRVRLTPEAIYQIVDAEYGGDRDQARRLLAVNGYLTA